MCEPHHSIVQYPTQDDGGNPVEPLVDALLHSNRPKLVLPAKPDPSGDNVNVTQDNVWAWNKSKILSWLHFSKLGFGHSETIGQISTSARRRLPADTKYEAMWWERKVVLDGSFHGPAYDQNLAMEAAVEYANRVSLGNLNLLRQFLELSMKKSYKPTAYIERFYEMLTVEGRNKLYEELNRHFGSLNTAPINELTNLVMGFTRKRKLLVSCWADDKKLWQ